MNELKALSDNSRSPEKPPYASRVSVRCYVVVFRRDPEQQVSDGAADDVGLIAGARKSSENRNHFVSKSASQYAVLSLGVDIGEFFSTTGIGGMVTCQQSVFPTERIQT